MGKRGTPLKPKALRELHGTDSLKVGKGHKRDISTTPEPQPGKVEPPKWLSKGARQIFIQYAPEYIRLRLLTESDVPAFAQWATHYDTVIQLTRDIEREGYTFETEQGPRANPKVTQRNKASELMHKYAMKFGMTPSDRMGLSVAPVEPDNEEKSVFGDMGNVIPIKK